jgi:hypothetical protein
MMADMHFRPGQSLKASDIESIIAQLISRISGGKGVRVRSFGNRLVVERDIPLGRLPGLEVPVQIMEGEIYALYGDTETGNLFIGEKVKGGNARIYRYDGIGKVDTTDYEELTGPTPWDITRNSADGYLYACTEDVLGKGRIFRSTDDGDNWSACSTSDPGHPTLVHDHPLVQFGWGPTYFWCADHDDGVDDSVWYALLTSGPNAGTWYATSQATPLELKGWMHSGSYWHAIGDDGYYSKSGGGWGQSGGNITGQDMIERTTPQFPGDWGFMHVYEADDDETLVARIEPSGSWAHVSGFEKDGEGAVRLAHSYDFESAGTDYIAYAGADDGVEVYRSTYIWNGIVYERVGQSAPPWGGNKDELFAAGYLDNRLYVACDGLWKCPKAW